MNKQIYKILTEKQKQKNLKVHCRTEKSNMKLKPQWIGLTVDRTQQEKDSENMKKDQ